MNAVERTALFMHKYSLTLVTAESCTAGLTAATLADAPGAGALQQLALGAARLSRANVAISNTGGTDSTDSKIPAGTQCFAWVFKRGDADASPAVYSETIQFAGGRNAIRLASAEHALSRLIALCGEWSAGLREGK